jgi:P27 family predicted phage terminase small subunit
MRGRKREPGAAARGTQHHASKPVQIAPLAYSGAISPQRALTIPLPRALPRTKAARELWQVILQGLAGHDLRAEDMPLIEALVVAKWRHSEASAFVKKYGPMIKGPKGTPVRNPMLKEERDQAMLYDRLAQRFGLSLESRVRLELMRISGTSLLSCLRAELDAAVDEQLDAVIEAEAIESGSEDEGS